MVARHMRGIVDNGRVAFWTSQGQKSTHPFAFDHLHIVLVVGRIFNFIGQLCS